MRYWQSVALGAAKVRAALIVNGSFETGDFAGWTQFGNSGFTSVQGVFGAVYPVDGSFQAAFGAVGSLGGIFQTVPVIVGQSYTLSFWVYNFGGTPSELRVDWGNHNLIDDVDPPAFGYKHYSFNVVAGGPEVQLSFQQDPSYFLLDDVSLTPVPEPSTYIAGALLLLPLSLSTLRSVRRKPTT